MSPISECAVEERSQAPDDSGSGAVPTPYLGEKSLAAIVPCFNEEATIARVLTQLRAVLPTATLVVYDNASSDGTADVARSMGAVVLREKRPGKGCVVQAMFENVEADLYVMVDGDDTYDLAHLPAMVTMVDRDEADLVLGARLQSHSRRAFRPFHLLGNRLVRFLVNQFFHARISDVMSGCRVMNRRFVKNINLTSHGFEVETEMLIKALKYGFVIKERPVGYRERPPGSHSKLRTVSDGLLVLKTIFFILRDYRPLLFFSSIATVLLALSLASGTVVVNEFAQTRYIRHVPLAILASGSMVGAIVLFVTGVILDSVNRRFDELHNLVRIKCAPPTATGGPGARRPPEGTGGEW